MRRAPARPDDLAAAWQRLDPPLLLHLITAHLGWSGWSVVKDRVEGPCPVSCEKSDHRSAYLYSSADGWSPWVRCHHVNSCGFRAPLVDLLAQRLGSRSRAAEAVKQLALVRVPRAAWPTVERMVVAVLPHARRA